MRNESDDGRRSAERSWPRGDGLYDLLGLDPTPTLSKDAVRRIHDRLADEGDGALDALLGLDEVDVPSGLAEGVLARVESEAAAVRRRRRLRLVPILTAAAAAVVLIVTRGDTAAPDVAPDSGTEVADVGDDVVGDEIPDDDFLAALPALENLDFLTEELDPLEADALFLMDAEDVLLLDLVEAGG